MKFNLGDWVLKRPYLIFSVLLLIAVLGVIGFFSMPMNLFPDANYPQVVVIIAEPGAAARDVEADVARPVEKALSAISLVRTVRSTSQDGMTAVAAEFDYKKGLDSAATDVANALKRIEARLPAAARPPEIFKVSDATAPVFTLALSAKKGSHLDLAKVRQLADNEIKEALLRVPQVGDVEVFGGFLPEIAISVDPVKLRALGISLAQVIEAVRSQNVNIPNGLIIRKHDQYRIKTYGEKKDLARIAAIVVAARGGVTVHLRDIAVVKVSYRDRQSLFIGNNREAIGVNILRPEKGGHVTTTIAALEKALPKIKARFPEINFKIADTQKNLIETSIKNMAQALRDSIIMTVLVIFVMLASMRLASLAAVSIPLVCFMTFAGMYMMGYELNIVTMTAIILSVGLLVDDTIVVIENIQRHAVKLKKPIRRAVVDGLNEIVLADWAGTFTTVIVLVPIMFVGGYPGKILRPLTVVLSLTLLSSFVVSVTVIPLLARYLAGKTSRNRFERIFEFLDRFTITPVTDFFSNLVIFALSHRLIFILAGVALFVVSMRQMPLVGRDLMPSMDTGIVKVAFRTEADSSLQATEKIARQVKAVVESVPGLKLLALEVGSEPGVVSFGTGRTPQDGSITAHFVDRFHRRQTIWQLEETIRQRAGKIPGITSLSVYDFGATPLSSIAAPVDIMISGPEPRVLAALAGEVQGRLKQVRGLTSVSRSWRIDKKEMLLSIDPQKAARFGMNPAAISAQIQQAIQGEGASILRVTGEDGYVIRVRYGQGERNDVQDIMAYEIATPRGPVPLQEFAALAGSFTRTVFTRKDLSPVIDVHGYRATTSISRLHERIVKALAGVELPPDYRLSYEGEYKNMGDTGKRLGKSLGIAVLLLFFSLVITFKSWVNPIVIMSAIPLSIIGAVWGLLITGQHMCMPATMGMILLTGIVVNNSILLIDFIEQARKRGADLVSAIQQAVKMRTRPIIMTASCTIVGMWPVAAQKAIGLERLSPLAVVVIGGLLVSTILTLVYVPIFYSLGRKPSA
ncbi:multidrug resistance protein MdtC [bacterium BMS3Bbin14]|nr:multidrug resistance protein MdtC [bacterium BMS3Abin13]GBE52672.1 multidrug resistance protein MdtC [bacterium BMS3Bbin14]